MTPDELAKYGRVLYGEHNWQAELANSLCITTHSLRRWLVGKNPIPGEVYYDVQRLLQEKYALLTQTLRTTFHECGPVLPTDPLEKH